MIPGPQPLSIYQGDDFDFSFRLKWKTSGLYLDLTSWVGKAQIRAGEASAVVVAEFTITLGDQTQPATLGLVTVSLARALTATLSPAPSNYIWDFQMISNVNKLNTYLKGPVTVFPEVTR